MDHREVPSATEAVVQALMDRVMGDSNLLNEILVRVALPTSLVRAACVCKRWYRLASAPTFLHRFRRLHSPRLLGFYVNTRGRNPSPFVSLPHPPELAAVVSRSSFDLDNSGPEKVFIDFCYSGFYIITSILPSNDIFMPTNFKRRGCFPVYPARYTDNIPLVPDYSEDEEFVYYGNETIPYDGDSDTDELSCFHLAVGYDEVQSILDLYVLEDGDWVMHTSVLSDIPKLELELNSVFADGKIYNLACVDDILKLVFLDLESESLSVVDLPEEMKSLYCWLTLADDYGVHLTYVKNSQVHVWLYRMDENGDGDWLLVDDVCLREIWANRMVPTFTSNHFNELCALDANPYYAIFKVDDALYMFDIELKDVKKIYELSEQDKPLHSIIPVTMVWPPKFPEIQD